jgi:hypothetical protein
MGGEDVIFTTLYNSASENPVETFLYLAVCAVVFVNLFVNYSPLDSFAACFACCVVPLLSPRFKISGIKSRTLYVCVAVLAGIAGTMATKKLEEKEISHLEAAALKGGPVVGLILLTKIALTVVDSVRRMTVYDYREDSSGGMAARD